MLLDAIVKLHDRIENMKLGKNRERQIEELEQARMARLPLNTQALPAQQLLQLGERPALSHEHGHGAGHGAAEAEAHR
jgi:hypothetical protein